MFDLVRNNKKVVQIVLALIMLPFALWGVDSYQRSGSGAGEIATVAEMPIGPDEFQRSLGEQQDRLRGQLGANAAGLLESADFRRHVLENLIGKRLLLTYAAKARMGVSNEALSGYIASQPALQVDGKFSRERYEALVAAQGMSVEQFEHRLRQDLLLQQAELAVSAATVAGQLPADRWLAAELEERVISEAVLRADAVSGIGKPDAAAVQRYYDENRARFERPEQVRVEYLVLSQSQMIEHAKVGENEIKAAYQAAGARYRKPEQRRASHILIRADKNAPADTVKTAQDKAEQVLVLLRANPGDFAKLAKQHSQDPGSAAKGGDLGYFGRGMMVKPFEEAAFALKENDLSDIVRSDFGFHIIKLTGIRPEQAQPLDEVRGEILAELRRQMGAKQYVEAAEGFANSVYEQSDSLKPAAEKYGLTVQVSDWLARDAKSEPPFNQAKLLQAVFAEDAVKNRRNTEAVEAAPNILISARVVEHKPAMVEPLETVATAIENTLMRESALEKAASNGAIELDKLRKGGKTNLVWGIARPVSRLQAQNLTLEAQQAIFAANPKTLPAYAGVKSPVGYAMYRIEQVKAFDPSATGETAARAQMLRQQYAQVLAQTDMSDWLATLREQYGVKINASALERK